MEDGFDIIQYRVKSLCNKHESNTDLLSQFWTSRLRQVRKIPISTRLPCEIGCKAKMSTDQKIHLHCSI